MELGAKGVESSGSLCRGIASYHGRTYDGIYSRRCDNYVRDGVTAVILLELHIRDQDWSLQDAMMLKYDLVVCSVIVVL